MYGYSSETGSESGWYWTSVVGMAQQCQQRSFVQLRGPMPTSTDARMDLTMMISPPLVRLGDRTGPLRRRVDLRLLFEDLVPKFPYLCRQICHHHCLRWLHAQPDHYLLFGYPACHYSLPGSLWQSTRHALSRQQRRNRVENSGLQAENWHEYLTRRFPYSCCQDHFRLGHW
jgi:hypothetical protein